MAQSSKLLDSDVVNIAMDELKKLGAQAYVSRKLYAVIAASKHGITKVAEVYDISRTTLTEWIKHIKANEVERLRAPESRRRRTKLNQEQMWQVRNWIEENPNLTITNPCV